MTDIVFPGGVDRLAATAATTAGSQLKTALDSGYAPLASLDSKADLVGGKLSPAQLPDLAITDYLGTVSTQSAMLALTGQKGDWCIRSDQNKVFVITAADPSVIGGWTGLAYPVSSVVAAAITDATSIGRSILTAADAAAERSLIGAQRQWTFDIRDYGATTGAADNATAIQAAISAASAAGGGTVVIPEGVWTTGPISLPSFVSLTGSGPYSSKLKLKNGANAHMLTLASVNTMWVGVQELCLDGNKANQTAGDVVHWDNTGYTTGATLLSNDPNHRMRKVILTNGYANGFWHTGPIAQMQLQGVFAYENGTNGFHLSVSPDNQLDHCIAAGNGSIGFLLDYAHQSRLVGCKSFLSGRTDGTSPGFQLQGAERCDLTHCEAQDNLGNGFALINVKDSMLIGKAERNGLGPSYAGWGGDGLYISGTTNSIIDVTCTDRKVSDTYMQRWAYNLGSGNTGNIVRIVCGQTASGVIGNGTWGANNVVTEIYNSGTPKITGVLESAAHAATSKATPVDADELALVDSAASNGLKKLTWANLVATLKSTLKTYFDTLATTYTNKSFDDATTYLLDNADATKKVRLDVNSAQTTNTTRTLTLPAVTDTVATLGGAENLSNKTLIDAKLPQSINVQTGTTYTLVLTDASKLITGNNASAITWTVPPNSSVAYSTGTSIDLVQLGAGAITISPGSGVTIRSRGSMYKTAGQYAAAALVKIGTDEWVLTGDLTS